MTTTTTTEFVDAAMKDLMAAKPKRTPDETTDEYVMRCMSAAVANSIKTLMAQEPVGVTDMAGGIHWKRGTPIQAKLYAAPMPQANESEAVKALRELHDAWADNSNDLPRMAAIKRIADRRLAAMKAARAVLAGEPGATGEPIPADRDVASILLKVVPGEDGMGHEVCAKSVKDVEDVLSAMSAELEDWQLGIRRYQTLAEQPKQAQAKGEQRSVTEREDRALRQAIQRGTKVIHHPQASGQTPPSGYAYRYPGPYGGIRFNNGGEVNGSKPVETIPYWLGQAQASGKAAPSDEDLQDVMDEFGTPNDWNGTITYIREQLLAACRELLAKYGNA